MVSGFRHQEFRRDRARHHESTHDLQHLPEVVLFPLILISSTLRLESIRKEDLNKPGAELARSSCDAMTCAAVACGKDLGWNLGFMSR